MERSVKKERTAHYINIPAEILKEMDIHAGDILDVFKENDYIKVRKVPAPNSAKNASAVTSKNTSIKR